MVSLRGGRDSDQMIKEEKSIREKVKIITLDAAHVKTFEDYTRLLKSGELKKYILEEREG